MNPDIYKTVPVLTTPAGNTLTAANWQAAGVKIASFHLSSLLVKPGYDFLKTLPNLATYVGWQGDLVLNATLPNRGKDGGYTLISPYDGCRIQHTSKEIMALIVTLKPTIVILPQGIAKEMDWRSLPSSIMPFLPASDLPDTTHAIKKAYGVYLTYDEKTSTPTEFLQKLELYKDRPCYVAGHLGSSIMRTLANHGACYLESDLPAQDACLGKVYCSGETLSIQEDIFSMQFTPIETNCNCPTCSQQLTRAYLHHLFTQTPLLCQRLLVQHNIYQALGWH